MIKYIAFPQVCGTCLNQALVDAEEDAERLGFTSVFCPHGPGVLVTALISVHEGEWVISGWSMLGPLTEEQAVEKMRQMAGFTGSRPTLRWSGLN